MPASSRRARWDRRSRRASTSSLPVVPAPSSHRSNMPRTRSSPAVARRSSPMPELRLLSYNVRSLRDDADAVSAVIRACAPDVVAVQEAPRFLRWRSKRAALARRSGLVVATANRPGGLMVMTSIRARVRETGFVLLPKTPKLHQRAVCSALVELDGAAWSISSLHLSLSDDERWQH